MDDMNSRKSQAEESKAPFLFCERRQFFFCAFVRLLSTGDACFGCFPMDCFASFNCGVAYVNFRRSSMDRFVALNFALCVSAWAASSTSPFKGLAYMQAPSNLSQRSSSDFNAE